VAANAAGGAFREGRKFGNELLCLLGVAVGADGVFGLCGHGLQKHEILVAGFTAILIERHEQFLHIKALTDNFSARAHRKRGIIILRGQKPVKAKMVSMAPTEPVNRNQSGCTKKPSTKIPANSLINRSRYHVFVSALYIRFL
jgi:hypothetical protein